MKVGDWRTIGGPGVLPLQVENAHTFAKPGGADENNNLWERPCLFGIRITNRDEDISKVPIGAYIEDPETRGDVIGSTFWKRATRDVGFWRFSTPVVTGDEVAGAAPSSGTPTGTKKTPPPAGKSVATGGMAASGDHCKEQDELHLGPVKKITEGDEWVQDKRVESITPKLPKDTDGNKLWPKFPKEYFGIVLSADWEDEQQELFHPTDPRMIAVNRKGDAEMGSLVCDMGDEFKIDSERMARLQAMEWVVKKPTSDYVSFYGRNSIAWNIGQSGCKDVRGGLIKDVDSNSLGGSSGTSSGGGGADKTGPLGLVSQRQNGPFEIPCNKHQVGKDEDGNIIYSTHLSMNSYFTFPDGVMDGPLKHDGYWVQPDEAPETAFVFFQYDGSLDHPFIGGSKKGKHRWWCQTNKYGPPWEPPIYPPDVPTPRPPGMIEIAAYLPDQGFLPYQYSSMEEGGISYIWRPQKFQSQEGDWRKERKPNRDYRRITADVQTPITGRFEAWGAQGEKTGTTILNSASDWVYTHAPNTYRYLSGTADGGVCFLSPEVDLADIDNDLAPLSGLAQSTSHLMVGRGARFGAGLPDLESGGISLGYSWRDDGSGGLTFATNASSTATDRVSFDVNGCVGVGGESYGGALGAVVFIANADRAPVSNPTGGGLLYVTGGALTYRGSSGTVTTLASA